MDYRELDKVIGEAVYMARLKAGLSQAALAEWMTEWGFGWHQTTVGKVESGERPLRLSEAVALGAKLNVGIPTLVGDPTDSRRRMAALLEIEIADAIREREDAARKVANLLERLEQIERPERVAGLMGRRGREYAPPSVERVTLADAQALIDDIAKGQTE